MMFGLGFLAGMGTVAILIGFAEAVLRPVSWGIVRRSGDACRFHPWRDGGAS